MCIQKVSSADIFKEASATIYTYIVPHASIYAIVSSRSWKCGQRRKSKHFRPVMRASKSCSKCYKAKEMVSQSIYAYKELSHNCLLQERCYCQSPWENALSAGKGFICSKGYLYNAATFIIFVDYAEFCRQMVPSLKQITTTYGSIQRPKDLLLLLLIFP